jgi:hypothetical protein
MKLTKLKELKEQKNYLFNQLLSTDISTSERVAIRSQYYKVTSDLYFMLAVAQKSNKHAKRQGL